MEERQKALEAAYNALQEAYNSVETEEDQEEVSTAMDIILALL